MASWSVWDRWKKLGLCLLPTIRLLVTWIGSRHLGQEPELCRLCHTGPLLCVASFAFSVNAVNFGPTQPHGMPVEGREDPNWAIGLLAPEATECRESRLPSTPFSRKTVKLMLPPGTGHEVRDRQNISHIQARTQQNTGPRETHKASEKTILATSTHTNNPDTHSQQYQAHTYIHVQ